MRKWMLPLMLILAVALAGCGKAPAEAALKAADDAIAGAKADVETYVPEELSKLTAAAADARAKFEAGDYKDALAAAKDIPANVATALDSAKAKKDELTGKWTEMQGAMPALVQGLNEKVASLEAMKRLPKGFDKTQLETAKASLAQVTTDWTAAGEAFSGGDLLGALSKAEGVRTRADELKSMLDSATPQK